MKRCGSDFESESGRGTTFRLKFPSVVAHDVAKDDAMKHDVIKDVIKNV